MKPRIVLPLVLLFGALWSSCYNDNKETLYPAPATGCDTTNVTYSGTLRAMTLTNCATAGCHAGATPSAGIDLTTYAGLKRTVTEETLLGSIRHEGGFSPMPKGASKLSDCQISQYAVWVAAGAPNN